MTIKEIKIYLKENKISYAELSQKSQIPETTLKSIFSFRTANPRIDTINAIQNALNIEQTHNNKQTPTTFIKSQENKNNLEEEAIKLFRLLERQYQAMAIGYLIRLSEEQLQAKQNI